MAKDIIILIKQQAIGWKIIFINYSFDGELMSKIYKEVKKWTSRKQTTQF